MFQEVIKAVMKERGVDPGEIPLESNFIVGNIARLSLQSRRYYRTKGFAHFSCSTCFRSWYSAHAWCVLDLRDECVVHTFGQECTVCTSKVMPKFSGEEVKKMAEYAVDQYLQRPIRKLADQMGPPHDERACEMCRMLGRSCYRSNSRSGEEVSTLERYSGTICPCQVSIHGDTFFFNTVACSTKS